MKKNKSEFDIGDIIEYKSQNELASHYYLVLAVGMRNYRILSFSDGKDYPLSKSDWSFYDRIS